MINTATRRLFIQLLCGLVLLSSCAMAATPRKEVKVIRVVDGDTIVVSIEGKTEKVRLLRVNTPESVHPDKKQNIPAGAAASDFTKKQLTDKTVELEAEGPDRDNYDRLLRYVWIDGKNFCLELVRQGHSPFYTPYGHGQYAAEFKAAEKEARDAKRGIWGDEDLTARYLRLKSKWGMDAAKYDSKAANGAAQPAPEQKKKEPAATSGYVASSRSDVFHRADCKHVSKIVEQNLVRFEGREEALKSGKRPCKVCGP